jgi:aspartate racemase
MIARGCWRIAQNIMKTIGLIGAHFTMAEDFYRGRLERQFGLGVLIPDARERETVHRVIYDELCVGNLRPESKVRLRNVLAQLARRGAEGVILGCTELGLLIGDGDSPVPLFDTTRIHARAAVEHALGP